MNKIKSLALSMLITSTSSFAGDEFKFLPIFSDDNYKGNIEVAAVLGTMNHKTQGLDNGLTYGVELSFDCPVFTLPGKNLLRQQLNLNRYDENGVSITSIEMNPYYFVDMDKDLKLGFGPGIGAMNVKPDTSSSEWLFTVQASAGIKYYMDAAFVGADIRYQWTSENDFNGMSQKQDLDNTRVLFKAGYAF